jgi:hypothetical protein
MRIPLSRSLAGLSIVAGLLALPGSPASANEVDVELTSGTVAVFDENSVLLGMEDHTDAGLDCAPPTRSLTTAGNATSGTITMSETTDRREVNIGLFRVAASTTTTGTYSNGVAHVTRNSVLTFVRTTGSGSCTPATGAGTCVIEWVDIDLVGLVDASDPSSLVPGDTIDLAGGNNPGDNVITSGTAGTCAQLIATNGGSTGYIDFVYEVS